MILDMCSQSDYIAGIFVRNASIQFIFFSKFKVSLETIPLTLSFMIRAPCMIRGFFGSGTVSPGRIQPLLVQIQNNKFILRVNAVDLVWKSYYINGIIGKKLCNSMTDDLQILEMLPGANELINWLWPSDTIQYDDIDISTLAQVVACCLTATHHCLNECWLIINEACWHLAGHDSQKLFSISFTTICLKITYFKIPLHLQGTKVLNEA